MFRKRKVENGAIHFNGRTYSAPELPWMHGKTVRISASNLYPESIALFSNEDGKFICLAKSKQTSGPSILREVAEMVGPRPMCGFSLEDWIDLVKHKVERAEEFCQQEHPLHSLDMILRTAAECVALLQYHIDKEAGKSAPVLAKMFSEIETADPADTESAA